MRTRQRLQRPSFVVRSGQIESERTLQVPTSAATAELTSLAKILDLATVIIHDVDGRILYWTTGCERLYGWSREEALGQVVHELLKTGYPAPRSKIVAKLRREGSWRGEIEHKKKTVRSSPYRACGSRENLRMAPFTPSFRITATLPDSGELRTKSRRARLTCGRSSTLSRRR